MNQEKLKVNASACRGLKMLNSISSLNGKFRFKIEFLF